MMERFGTLVGGVVLSSLTGSLQAAPLSCELTGLVANQNVQGVIYVQAQAPAEVRKVDFSVDGVWVNLDTLAPYYLNGDVAGVPQGWQTQGLAFGPHEIKARVVSRTGQVCLTTLPFTTATVQLTAPETAVSRVPGLLTVNAVPTIAVSQLVFSLAGQPVLTLTEPPYTLDLDIRDLALGAHTLQATGYPQAGGASFSADLAFTTTEFSSELSVYPVHPTASTKSVDQILNATATTGLVLSPGFADKRREIATMYRTAGFDLSLSPTELRTFLPQSWSLLTPQPLSGGYLQPYSVDASFYHKIPADRPKVQLPLEHITYWELAVEGGTNTQQGYTIGTADDDLHSIIQKLSPTITYTRRVRDDAYTEIPGGNDRHLSFIDETTNDVVTCYHTRLVTNSLDFDCDWASVSALGTLADQGGGTDAAKIPNLAMVLRDGEATHPTDPIPHALGGPLGISWKAMVYPALGVDGYIDNINYGLVPYGGVIQLDPTLDLLTVRVEGRPLSLPARRILQAIQEYGYYVWDNRNDKTPTDKWTGASIWTTTEASEFYPYRYGKGDEPAAGIETVKAELKAVMEDYRVYVVLPLVKK
ncbi:hypothetical protein [Candidatus Cyanaurora vandensis]|uniref:hypothetical protein n=1 Tax=Candidatus Cyanaurora vandensis TaxID=2714958 RepID=UPI00257A1497|nr:hypothetical protein [Candidatus Cyanaurora vandensis]